MMTMTTENEAARTAIGTVRGLWRYPVKSMLGEELDEVEITPRGLLGDRAFALIDAEDGRVVSAKSPRKWGRMFECRSITVEPPGAGGATARARITLPDGSHIFSDDPDLDRRLSGVLGRPVRLAASAPEAPRLEEYQPGIDGPERQDPGAFQDAAMLAGTFFDAAPVFLMTTASLDELRRHEPSSRFEVPRFRPNLLIEVPPEVRGFAEDPWIGRSLTVGAEVVLKAIAPCPRCVMTTLPQGDLPRDPKVLRTIARQNGGNLGVYASVTRGGRVRRGDRIRVDGP